MEYTPQNMQTVSQLPLGMLWGGLEQLKEGQIRDQATLAATQQENIRKQQAHEMAQRQGAATLAGTQITNDTNSFNLGQKRKTMDAETRSQLAKFGAEADEADWKSAVVKINQGRMRGDPAATELYELLPEITAARKLAEAAKAKAEQESKDKRYVAEVGAQSRETVAKTSAAARTAGGVKTAKSPRELMTYYTTKANETQDESLKEKLLELADAEWEKVQQEIILKAQAALAGKVDPSQLGSGSGIATQPTPTPTVIPRPGPKPTAVVPMYATNPKTKERIVSEDGGQTWKPAK